MAIQSAPYYWVTCDEDGCDLKSTSGNFEVSAWDSESMALEDAEESDWWIGKDGDHFCYKHVPKCESCGLALSTDKTCLDYDESTHPEV